MSEHSKSEKEEEEKEEVVQVQWFFKTNIQNPDYHVAEDVITLGSDSTRKRLTKVIHALLENSISEKVKFEFLINGQMLREDLGSMMKKNHLSNDEIIEITYTFAMHKPKEDQKIENDEWIKSIKTLFQFEPTQSLVPTAVGFFDGSVKLYDNEFNIIYNKKLHEDVVNDLLFIEEENNEYTLITASNDEEIQIHKLINNPDKVGDSRVAMIMSHANALTFWPTDSQMIAYAGNDAILKIADIGKKEVEENQEREVKKNKRVKTSLSYLKPSSSIEGNKHAINWLKWINNSEIVTGGYDHAIRVFNVDKEELASSIYTNNKTTSWIDSIKDRVIVGSEDHGIRLWDIRTKGTEPIKVFKAHNAWVSSVKFNPNSDYHFISSAYDSRTLVWDLRWETPLYKIGLSPAEKIFSCDWNTSSNIISGGDSGSLQIHCIKQKEM